MKINIAIDGPAGSGKSSLSQALAQKLNYQFLDSGLFYRYFAKVCAENGINWQEKEKVVDFCSQQQREIAKNSVLFLQRLESQRFILMRPQISNLASQYSPIQELRQIIYRLIRDLVKNKGFVIVGRDMTFKVLPEAEIKIFLTAQSEKRAQRRYWQLRSERKYLSLEEVKKDLNERDKRDQNNILQAQKVSLEIDNSDLSLSESLEKIYKLYKEKIN